MHIDDVRVSFVLVWENSWAWEKMENIPTLQIEGSGMNERKFFWFFFERVNILANSALSPAKWGGGGGIRLVKNGDKIKFIIIYTFYKVKKFLVSFLFRRKLAEKC